MNRRGFTLIELLVVIAIIAILAAILFPVFAGAKERGRQATCCSNLKQLSLAFFGYCDDHNGFLPVSQRRQMIRYGGPQGAGAIEWTGSLWSEYGAPPEPCDPRLGSLYRGGYAKSVGIFNCPSDKDIPSYYGSTKIAWSNQSSWPAPSKRPANWSVSGLPSGFGVTYSMNEQLTSKTGSDGYLTTIKLDSAVAGRTKDVLFLIHEFRGKPNRANQNDGYYQWTAGDDNGEIHYDGTTCSYADGHVKWISNNEIDRMIAMRPSPWYRNSYYYGHPNPAYSE